MPKKKKLIEVGDPKKVATVGRGVKKVLYKGKEREVAEFVDSSEKELRIDRDHVSVFDFDGNLCYIYLT